MSKKLTKEMLDALIQEAMLQERLPYNAADLERLTKGKKLAKDLAKLEPKDDELGVNDIRKAFTSDDPKAIKKVIREATYLAVRAKRSPTSRIR